MNEHLTVSAHFTQKGSLSFTLHNAITKKTTKAFKDTVAFAITNALLSVINTAETKELF